MSSPSQCWQTVKLLLKMLFVDVGGAKDAAVLKKDNKNGAKSALLNIHDVNNNAGGVTFLGF